MSKRKRAHQVTWLHLHGPPYWLPRDIRKKVYDYLTPEDKRLVQWAHNRFRPVPFKDWTRHVQYGHLDVLKWLYQHDDARTFTCDTTWGQYVVLDTFVKAAEYGHIHVLEWLCDIIPDIPYDDINICYRAARNKQMEALKWLYEHDFVVHQLLYEAAAITNNLPLIHWLHERGTPLTSHCEAPEKAAKYGHLDALKLLYRYGRNYLGYGHTLDEAIVHGHVHVVEWLLNVGCPTFALVESVAKGGHVHVAQWLYEHGHLDVSKCLRQAQILQDHGVNRREFIEWCNKVIHR